MDKIRDYENNLEQEEYICTFAVQQSNRKRVALQVNIWPIIDFTDLLT